MSDTEKPPREKTPRKVSRREAREVAMILVLSALTLEVPAAECLDGISAILDDEARQRALQDKLAQQIVRTFDAERGAIEAWMEESWQAPLAHMTMMERAIISAGAAEMIANPKTPRGVVINEGIELAKRFGAEGGGGLVNGVLDAIGKRLA